jgi:segregation and condensation protein B
MDDLKNIIESLLFVSETPLTIDQIRAVVPGTDSRDVRNCLNALCDDYDSMQRAFYLREVAGGFQFRSRPQYKEFIGRLAQSSPPRLSKAALETLAIIAYKQPIIRSDIEHIRSVDCGGVLRLLMERKLIRVLGRREIPGRPLIYATTKQFLELFDLRDLKDLPTPKEIADLGSAEAEKWAAVPPTPSPPAPENAGPQVAAQQGETPGLLEPKADLNPAQAKGPGHGQANVAAAESTPSNDGSHRPADERES